MSRNLVEILGIKFDNLTEEEAVSRLSELLDRKGHALVTTPNPEFIITSQKDDSFRQILNERSKLNLSDGIGLLWAARFLSLWQPGNKYLAVPIILIQWLFTLIFLPFIPRYFQRPLRSRVPGSDFIWNIAKLAAEKKQKLFLLGGAATVAERAALRLQTDIVDLRIAGVHSGTPDQTPQIIEAVNKSRADILLVCFGAPKQEKWLDENLAKTCCKVGIGLGGTFDFIAGERRRSPLWMQRSGLEWLYRLIVEPRRLRRQLVLPVFIWQVLIERFKKI